MSDRWPQTLWLIRHGESAGNVARARAEAEGNAVIAIEAERELDVPLSPLGEEQARALSHHFARLPEGERPTAQVSSPYLRARRTGELAMARLSGVPAAIDERLREREFGLINRLTRRGIEERHPELVELRKTLGKMYFRAPGGESWCDVLLRLRSFLDTASREHAGGRVVLFTHQVVVLLFRALLEGLEEAQLYEIDRTEEIANCSITEYRFDPALGASGRMRLVAFNQVAPLVVEGAPVTGEKDASVAPR